MIKKDCNALFINVLQLCISTLETNIDSALKFVKILLLDKLGKSL